MPSVFSKNCIFSGDLDCYCLVCSTHLPGEDKVLTHILEPKHNDNLKSINYFEKYKDDFIRKLKGIYFCEICNMTFNTAAKVGVHVTEDKHVNGKRLQLERVGTSIVFQKNTVIEERAWNGLVEDTCVLCNAEFEDVATHQSEPAHVLNVVRSSVTVDDNNNIYRKVDCGIQCLICNVLVSDNMIAEHFHSTEHKGAIVKFDYIDNQVNDRPNEEKNKDSPVNPVKDIVDNKSKNTLTNSYTAGKSLDTKPVLTKEKPTISKTITAEVETLAKQHNLTVNKYRFTVNCKVCIVELPATLNCVKDHVSGKKHNDKLRKKNLKNPNKIEKVLMKNFVKDFTHVETIDNEYGEYAIFNNEFCVKTGDYIGFAKFGSMLICQFCHIDLTPGNALAHLISTSHINIMENCYVITSLKDEFVRQMKSDLYHCGYCGHVENDYDEMLEHLTTKEHKTHRAERKEFLQQILLVEARDRRRSELVNFCRFIEFMDYISKSRMF